MYTLKRVCFNEMIRMSNIFAVFVTQDESFDPTIRLWMIPCWYYYCSWNGSHWWKCRSVDIMSRKLDSRRYILYLLQLLAMPATPSGIMLFKSVVHFYRIANSILMESISVSRSYFTDVVHSYMESCVNCDIQILLLSAVMILTWKECFSHLYDCMS